MLRAAGCLLAVAASASAARAQRTWTVGTIVGRAEHRIDIGRGTLAGGGAEAAASSEGNVDRAAGTVVGGVVEVGATDWLELRAHALGGRLDAATPGLERGMGELSVRASVLAFPWLAFQAGALSRAYELSEGRQRWTVLETGAEARLGFSGDAVRGIVRATLLPAVSISGLEHPDLGVSTAAGIEMRRGFLSGGILYSLERYDFPAAPDAQRRRLEQMGMLTARLGVRF